MTTAYQPPIRPLGAGQNRAGPAQTQRSGHLSLDDARAAFLQTYPEFASTSKLDDDKLETFLDRVRPKGNHLFAYPAQSNFTGVQHPLAWIERAQANGWDVLLDAAAYVPTNHLDLGRWRPDFCVMSFYKIFGYPTGIGCLLARKTALAKLRRPWFAGGTITLNLYDPNGQFVDHRLVEYRANQANISLRTGCFCNPGGGELALGISAKELSTCFTRSQERLTLGDR